MVSTVDTEHEVTAGMDLPTESVIPWTATANLGDGVAAPSGELLRSCVEPFTAAPGDDREEKLDYSRVDSEDDIKTLVAADVHAGFNTAALAVSAHTHVVNSLSVSERSSTVVFKGLIKWRPALASPLPRLSAEALKLYERDPSAFHRAHGDYFIAGFTKQAELTLFARVTGTNRESVRRISADVEANIQNVAWKADAKAAAALDASARGESCKIEITLLKTGMSDDRDADVPGLTLSDVPAHVEDFQKRAVGTKTAALLVHYTRIEPKISTRTAISAEMYEMANRFYEDLLVARVLRNRLPKKYAAEMQKALKEIETDSTMYVPRDLSGDLSRLHDLRERIEDWLLDSAELEEYRRLWHDVNALPPAKATGLKWGVTSWNGPRPAAIEATTGSLRRPYKFPEAYQSGRLAVNVPERRICGIQLVSNRRHAGDHKLVKGGLNQDFVEFEFTSEYARGFNWTATVWSVPEKNAWFDADEL